MRTFWAVLFAIAVIVFLVGLLVPEMGNDVINWLDNLNRQPDCEGGDRCL